MVVERIIRVRVIKNIEVINLNFLKKGVCIFFLQNCITVHTCYMNTLRLYRNFETRHISKYVFISIKPW